jgi:hypothetical protein
MLPGSRPGGWGRAAAMTAPSVDTSMLVPVRGPAAWLGPEQRSCPDHVCELTLADVEALDAAVRSAAGRDAPAPTSREQFPLASLAVRLEAMARELAHGVGFCLIRGIPLERYDLRETGLLLCGIGTHFGRPMPQDAGGGIITHVRDTGPASPGATSVRGYRTCQALPFHSDSCDVVGLLCRQTAATGGVSSIASSYAIHDALVEARPDLLRILYEPFFIERHTAGPAARMPWYATPVFMRHRGSLFCRFNPGYVYSAQRHPETPRLTARQIEAMELVMELCGTDRFRFDMELRPGDLQLLNNNVLVHARTAYQDTEKTDLRRHLLRLWLFTSAIGDVPGPMRDRYRDMESWQVNATDETCG